jgi:hypothetical protein
MIRDYSSMHDHVIRRMARRIEVVPQNDAKHPYRAFIRLRPPPAAPGHPYMLVAEGNSPEEAVDEIVAMIVVWFEDPTSDQLLAGSRRAPGLVRPRPPTTPAVQ